MSGLYRIDNWENFLAQPERVPSWKIPFNIAVALHLVVFAGAVALPDVGKRPAMDNVVVVDLLSLPPAAPAPEVEQQVVMPQAKKKEFSVQQPEPVQRIESQATEAVPEVVDSEPEKIEKLLKAPDPVPEIAPEPKIRHQSPPQSIAQAKPVSLRPLKRKKKLAEDVRLAEVKEQETKEKKQAQERQAQLAALEKKRLAEQRQREQAAEEEKRRIARKKKQQQAAAKRRQAELQAEQRRREREIAEAARLARQAEQAAEQARLEAAALKREYASVSQAVSSLNDPISSRASGGSAESSDSRGWGGNGVYSGSGSERGNPAVLKQYIASLHGRISSNWQVPEILKKKSHLRAMVALTIGRDGAIKDMRIEQKSGNSIFDQSVLKALQSSAPFPDFPVLIDKSTLEFALNFTPQGLAF